MEIINFNFNKIFNYILSLESIYILFLIILNIVNLCIFYNNKNIIFFNGILLLAIYLLISERKDKKILIIAMIHFAFYGVLLESLIIKKSNLLKYSDPSFLNIPLWLIPVYCLFTITAIYTYEFFKLII